MRLVCHEGQRRKDNGVPALRQRNRLDPLPFWLKWHGVDDGRTKDSAENDSAEKHSKKDAPERRFGAQKTRG
jgi:hypothetical protein